MLLLGPGVVKAQCYFEEVSSQRGVGVSYGTGYLGGGVSFFDFNGDGWDDLTLSSADGQVTSFFRNQNGNFVRETFNIPETYQTKQVQWVDYDNDGDKDFFATSDIGLTRLYQNDGDFHFSDISHVAGLDSIASLAFGASWGDYDNDGWLDLFICYRNIGGTRPNTLFKNNGDGTFVDVTVQSGLHQSVDPSFCASFFDYNKDGWQDIYIANDRFVYPNILYKNNGDGTFTDASQTSGTDLLMAAMSVTIGDYNNDSWPDIYITNVYNPDNPEVIQTNALLRNNGDETFTEVAMETGTAFNSIAWGAVFLDGDNDMDLDLYVSGMLTDPDPLPSAFYENQQNYFSIPTNAGFDKDRASSFSNAIGDLNNDGLPDIVVINEDNANIFLWENQSSLSNNWISVSLEGTESNRDGIGSQIELAVGDIKQYRSVLCGEGYLGQNSGQEFFGLGSATIIDSLKITWPSGQEDTYYEVFVNEKLHLVEGALVPTSSIKNGLDNIDFFPNPTNGQVQIDGIQDAYKLEVFDSQGIRLIEELQLNEGHLIDIRHFPKGIYFFRVSTKQYSLSKKIIYY